MQVAATFSVSTMDPTASAAGGTITVPNMVYNRLLGMVGGPRKDPFAIELEPELAASWERTPDGQTFTFNLRDDVSWQNVEPLNGRPFTSADVKYAYDRYSRWRVCTSPTGPTSEAIEAPDDHTLTITMSKVTADFILPLASRYQTIFPRELVEDGSINERVVGTGPMILTELDPASRVTCSTRTPTTGSATYSSTAPSSRSSPTYSARLAAFRVGQIDYSYALASNIQRRSRRVLETNPDVQINMNVLDSGGLPLGLNLSNPKFAGRAGAPGDGAGNRHRLDGGDRLRRPREVVAAAAVGVRVRRRAHRRVRPAGTAGSVASTPTRRASC